MSYKITNRHFIHLPEITTLKQCLTPKMTSMTCQHILIFGGTNDSWVPVRIGDYKYSDWTETDKEYFRPAVACMIDYLMNKYPESTIVFIKNTGLGSSFSSSIDTICSHYGVTEVILSNIDKGDGHPTVLGMQQINTQVRNTLSL